MIHMNAVSSLFDTDDLCVRAITESEHLRAHRTLLVLLGRVDGQNTPTKYMNDTTIS